MKRSWYNLPVSLFQLGSVFLDFEWKRRESVTSAVVVTAKAALKVSVVHSLWLTNAIR